MYRRRYPLKLLDRTSPASSMTGVTVKESFRSGSITVFEGLTVQLICNGIVKQLLK